jgi:PTS system ascorbate-specific IIA component
MVGLLLVAHGKLGDSLIECTTYVHGHPPEGLRALDLTGYPDPEAMLSAVRKCVAELDDGSGVLVLTDIYGATPSNTVCRLVKEGSIGVVAGVNLPMLLKALTYRNEPLESLAERIAEGGRAGIFHVEECDCDART